MAFKPQATPVGSAVRSGVSDATFGQGGGQEGTFAFLIGAIMFAFVVYITAKGELPTYLQFFIYTPPASGGTAANATGSNVASTTAAGAPVSTANTFWNFITGNWYTSGSSNATPLTTPAPGTTGSGPIGSA
jgi:hypothetical protein